MIAPPDHAAGPETPLGALIWRLPPGSEALSSATVGGGFARPEWMLNLRVGPDYARTDVAEHIATVARSLALTGDGIGFLTAADVGRYGHQEERGVRADATAGVSEPTWAAASDEVGPAPLVGTVNIVVRLPVALDPAAAVNAVATITEAKCQAFFERDIPGTGTPTDAVAVVWLTEAETTARFGGPRSEWGAVLARVTRDAVGAAIDHQREAMG